MGKLRARRRRSVQPVTLDLWKQHVARRAWPLGVGPIREDSTCLWGSIDVDDYAVDPIAMIVKIRELHLPLVPCRSKSGGMHLFLFLHSPVPGPRDAGRPR